MRKSQIGSIVLLALAALALGACSRVKEDWKAAQAADTTEAYQEFLRAHPDSEFGVAAQERVRQLAEDRDWQQAAKADTLDAYQQFVAAHADGKWAQEARVRIENFQLSGGGQAPGAVPGADTSSGAPATAAAASKPQAPSTAAAANPKAATASKSAPHGSSAAAGSTGRHYAQLGAYSSKSSAESAWHTLSSRFPTQLKSLQPHYAATTGAKPLVRLQVALPTSERAQQLCTQLKQQSQPCIPVS